MGGGDDMVRVEDRMSRNVLTVVPSETLDRTAQVMTERKVGSAVVIRDGRLEGIVTERDILRAVARGLVPWSTEVKECMTERPVTVSPAATSGQAMSLMLNGGFRHLPVMEDGVLAGIVSLRDLASD